MVYLGGNEEPKAEGEEVRSSDLQIKKVDHLIKTFMTSSNVNI